MTQLNIIIIIIQSLVCDSSVPRKSRKYTEMFKVKVIKINIHGTWSRKLPSRTLCISVYGAWTEAATSACVLRSIG